MTYHAEGGGIIDHLYRNADESESDEENVEPIDFVEEGDSDNDYDDDVSDIDEQIEKQTNEQQDARYQAQFDNEINQHLSTIEDDSKMQTMPGIRESSEESEEDDSDLELIEENFEDEIGRVGQKQHKRGDLQTGKGEHSQKENYGNKNGGCWSKLPQKDPVKNVDTLIKSYLDNLLFKREKWGGRHEESNKSEEGKSTHLPSSPGSPGSPDSGIWSPEPAEEEEGSCEKELSRVQIVKNPHSLSKFEERPKMVNNKIPRQHVIDQSVSESKVKVDLKSKKVKRGYVRKVALKSRQTPPESSGDCKKANSDTNYEYEKETIPNGEGAKKIGSVEACRYCKSLFNLAEIQVNICHARTDQQLNRHSEFDADTYFENFYKESMGDYLFFAEKVESLSKEDVDIFKSKDESNVHPLCSECSDDFYWPLGPSQGVTRHSQDKLIHSCPVTRHGARMVGGLLLEGGPRKEGELRSLSISKSGLLSPGMVTCTWPGCNGCEEPMMKVRRPYKKCAKCKQYFCSKDALSQHIASFHTTKRLDGGKEFGLLTPFIQMSELPVAKEKQKEERQEYPGKLNAIMYRRPEDAENRNEARSYHSVVKSSDPPNCRFCKAKIFLEQKCPERMKKAPVQDVFDAKAYLEAEFDKFMGDQAPGDIDVFSPEDLGVMQETKSEHMLMCPECHDDFFWPTLSHRCVFTEHGRVVLGGRLVGALACLDQAIVDCKVCPPPSPAVAEALDKCGQCHATFNGKEGLKDHKKIYHQTTNKKVPLTHMTLSKVNQEKVPKNWFPSNPLKRSAEAILFNLPKSTRIELNGRHLQGLSRGVTPERKQNQGERQCDECGEKFGSAIRFEAHLFDPLSDIFVCMQCAAGGKEDIGDFPNQCQLSKHKKSAHKKQLNTNFDCSSCGLSYKSRYLLKKHMQNTTSCKQISKHQLSAGRKKFPLNGSVSIEYKQSVGSSDSMGAGNGEELTESVILAAFNKVDSDQHHGQDPDSIITCLYCTKRLKNTQTLKIHLKLKHNVEYKTNPLIPCNYCDKEFKEKGKLREHVEENHERNVSPVTVGVNLEDFKMLFPQERLEVKKEIFPNPKDEFCEKYDSIGKAELEHLVEGELDERQLMSLEVERMIVENTKIKVKSEWIFQ